MGWSCCAETPQAPGLLLALHSFIPSHVSLCVAGGVCVGVWCVVCVLLCCRFSGTGDVMAGALVLNPHSPFYRDLKQWQNLRYEDLLYEEDAVVLEKNSRDFPQRLAAINRTTQRLVAWLQQQPQVERVYTPYTQQAMWGNALVQQGGGGGGGGGGGVEAAGEGAEGRGALRHPSLRSGPCPGFGGLFSLVLRNAEVTSAPFYDAVRVSKGPSLGNNFTLLCPYTLLAHYAELGWAESVGIHRFLLRFSIGLEEEEDLKQRLSEALHSIQPIIQQHQQQHHNTAQTSEEMAIKGGGQLQAPQHELRESL